MRGLDRGVPHPHDLRPRGPRERLRLGSLRCGARSNAATGLAVVDAAAGAAHAATSTSARRQPFQLHGLLPRGQALHAGARRRARPADRPARAADRDRRALRHGATRDGRDLDVAAHARGDVRRPRPAHRVPVRAPRPASTPTRPRSSSSRRSSPTACRPTRSRTLLADAVAALAHVRPPDHGVHGARPDRRRHRARRHHRPLGRRAAPADRRPARDRVPAADGAVELPDRVVVHRAHVDRARHHPRASRSPSTSSTTPSSSRAGATSASIRPG